MSLKSDKCRLYVRWFVSLSLRFEKYENYMFVFSFVTIRCSNRELLKYSHLKMCCELLDFLGHSVYCDLDYAFCSIGTQVQLKLLRKLILDKKKVCVHNLQKCFTDWKPIRQKHSQTVRCIAQLHTSNLSTQLSGRHCCSSFVMQAALFANKVNCWIETRCDFKTSPVVDFSRTE